MGSFSTAVVAGFPGGCRSTVLKDIIIIIIIIIIVVIIIIIISFMEGIYTFIPETNYVPREYNFAAILLLLFMVLITLVSVLNLLYFYISTFRCMWAVPNMAVFCSFIIIIIITIEIFTSQLWLGNIHLSWDAAINSITFGGLICSLKSSLQLNMCQELHIFAAVYMYWGAS